MSRFDVIRVIVDTMKERNYLGLFNISYVSDCIVVAMIINDCSISRVISMAEVRACKEPRYMIRLVINDIINQIRSGGTAND